MRRSSLNMEYYMDKEPGGFFVMLGNGKIVGSIASHVWGSVGWFGPLEVNPVCQGKGYGKALVERSVEHLRARGCTTIGCETMAGSPKNIAFYHKLGFKAMSLSHVLYKRLGDVPPKLVTDKFIRPFNHEKDIPGCRKLWNGILPGLDYSVELASVTEKGLGDIWAVDSEDGPAHAIVHTYEMFDDSQNAIIKLLVAGKNDMASAGKLLDRCEVSALTIGKTGMFIRTYDINPPKLDWFFGRGYALQGTSVRLILDGPDEADETLHISCWSA